MEAKKTQCAIKAHFKEFPEMELRDMFKFLYQSSFGCEHLLISGDSALSRIKDEYAGLSRDVTPKVYELDGDYVRADIGFIGKGLDPMTLTKLFCMSAKKEPNAEESLKNKLLCLEELVREGALPFDERDLLKEAKKWEASGFEPVSHSARFKKLYSPAYRVISSAFADFLFLFAMIDKKLKNGRVILAVEGGSASGKSTLGDILERVYGCAVFHMDDFFLRPEQRTAERFAQIGGNVDRERFLEQVLLPLRKGEDVTYQKFDCSSFTLKEPITVSSTRLTVVEGAYSMHPELSEYYDASVFLDIGKELQKKRIEKRNSPDLAKRFFHEWIPMEDRYFEGMDVKARCDLTVKIKR